MPKLAVIFDTNVYRSMNPEVFRILLAGERAHSILGFANYGTIVELLANLIDEDRKESGSALAAAKLLVSHCTEYDGSVHVVRFVASPLGQVTRFLFGRIPTDEEDPNGLSALIGQVVHFPDSIKDNRNVLEALRKDAEIHRKKYTDMLWETVVLSTNPNAGSWAEAATKSDDRKEILTRIRAGEGKPVLAHGMVESAAKSCGLSLSSDSTAILADKVAKTFGVLIEYRSLVIEKLITHGMDMTKRDYANGVFDHVVCGATAGHARLRGGPVVVVTDDGDVLEAARRAGMVEEFLSSARYAEIRKLDSDAFDMYIQDLSNRQDSRR